jgi:hypothetical protein
MDPHGFGYPNIWRCMPIYWVTPPYGNASSLMVVVLLDVQNIEIPKHKLSWFEIVALWACVVLVFHNLQALEHSTNLCFLPRFIPDELRWGGDSPSARFSQLGAPHWEAYAPNVGYIPVRGEGGKGGTIYGKFSVSQKTSHVWEDFPYM